MVFLSQYEPKKPHYERRALGVMPRPDGRGIMTEQPPPSPGYLQPPRVSSHSNECDPPQSFPQYETGVLTYTHAYTTVCIEYT